MENETINLDPKFKASKVNGFSLKEAVRKPDFYFFIVFAIIMGMLNNPIYTAAPSVMRDQKFSETFMSMIISLLFLILAVAKVVIGFLYDKYGAQIVLTICLLFNLLGILTLSNLDTNIKAIIFSVALGISIPLETLVIPMIVMEFFGNKDAITLNGIFFSCVTLGIALGNPIVNYFYDLNGSYGGVFRVFALISIGCLVAISIAFSKNKSVNRTKRFGIVEGE